MNSENYIVKSRDSVQVIPKKVEFVNRANKYLNYLLMVWSVFAIISYFAGLNLPAGVDATIGATSICISIACFLYVAYVFKDEELYKVAPALEKRKNIFNKILP